MCQNSKVREKKLLFVPSYKIRKNSRLFFTFLELVKCELWNCACGRPWRAGTCRSRRRPVTKIRAEVWRRRRSAGVAQRAAESPWELSETQHGTPDWILFHIRNKGISVGREENVRFTDIYNVIFLVQYINCHYLLNAPRRVGIVSASNRLPATLGKLFTPMCLCHQAV